MSLVYDYVFYSRVGHPILSVHPPQTTRGIDSPPKEVILVPSYFTGVGLQSTIKSVISIFTGGTINERQKLQQSYTTVLRTLHMFHHNPIATLTGNESSAKSDQDVAKHFPLQHQASSSPSNSSDTHPQQDTCRVALQKPEHLPQRVALKSEYVPQREAPKSKHLSQKVALKSELQPASMKQSEQPASLAKHNSEEFNGTRRQKDEGRHVSRRRREAQESAASVGVTATPRESGELKLFELTRALKRFKHEMDNEEVKVETDTMTEQAAVNQYRSQRWELIRKSKNNNFNNGKLLNKQLYRAEQLPLTNQELDAKNKTNQQQDSKTKEELDKFRTEQKDRHHKLGRSSRAVAPSNFEGASNWAPILQMVAAGAGDSEYNSVYHVVLENRRRRNLGLNLIEHPTSRPVTTDHQPSTTAADSDVSDDVKSSPTSTTSHHQQRHDDNTSSTSHHDDRPFFSDVEGDGINSGDQAAELDVTRSVFGASDLGVDIGDSARPIDRLFYSTPSLLSDYQEEGCMSESIFTEQLLYNDQNKLSSFPNDQNMTSELEQLNQVERELKLELNELNRLTGGGQNRGNVLSEDHSGLYPLSSDLSSISSVTITSISDNVTDCGELKYYSSQVGPRFTGMLVRKGFVW
eukprot:sb/3462967/